ncbi:MAG: hypothetical protein QXP54_05795 [Thermofilum sp.]
MKPIYRCRRCGVLTEEELHCRTPAELVLEGDRRERLSKLMSGALRHFPKALAHPDPVVLAVNPDCMKGRVKLFRASKTVYVAPYVPSECISIASGDRELSLPERAGES